MVEAFIQSALQYHEHMWYIFSMAGLSGKQTLDVSALPMELNKITRLQMLLKLVLAVLFASALPVCSPMPLLASPLPLWTCVDIFRYWWPVLCGSAAVCCLSSPVWTLPPWLIGAALCCPTFLLCGPAFWLIRAAVSCAWSNHVAPPTVTSHGSVKRQGPPSTHPPASPSQITRLGAKN